MTSFLEKCNEFSRSKTARYCFWIIFALASCLCVYRIINWNTGNSSSSQVAPSKFFAYPKSKLEVIPHPDDDSLLHVKGTIDDALAWSRKIDEFLAPYRTPHPNRQKCDYNNPPAPGKSCDFDLTKLGFCSSENNYGFSKGSPCVFLKLRKTPSWTPEYLNASDVPSDLPEDLKYHLTVGHDRKQKAVLLSCHGDYPADAENIGPISFFPSRSYYDYQISNEEGSLEPIIAILFEQPTKGVVINVKCQIWWKNGKETVPFELLVD